MTATTADDEVLLLSPPARPDAFRFKCLSGFVLLATTFILLASLDLHSVKDDDALLSLARVAQQRNRVTLSKQTLQNILNRTSTIMSNKSAPISYVPPCSVATNVVESTSALLVASTLLKADNETLQNYDLWQFFDGLFPIPSSAFIPRFAYPIDKNTHDSPLYVQNTRIPNWPLFAASNSSRSFPCRKNQTSCWVGSSRISAIPFHGTFLLELVLQMGNRDFLSEGEMMKLQQYWEMIYDYHVYLHETVMRGCGSNGSNPCYNIVHPWESLMEPTSPAWELALEPALSRMYALNWSLPFEVPRQIEKSYDYNATTYSAMIFLAECLANQTHNGNTDHDDNYPYAFRGDAAAREDQILRECPFAMLDVGYASALAQADDDLYHAGLWLSAQGSKSARKEKDPSSSSWDYKLGRFKQWRKQTKHTLRLLWHQDEHTFLSHYGVPPFSNISVYPSMHPIKLPVTNNLMIFWKQWGEDSTFNFGRDAHVEEMSIQMLRHYGKYSFDCQSYPLWSAGCDNPTGSIVDPRLNFFIGVGLFRNKDTVVAFGDYLTNVTIDLICQSEPSSTSCASNFTNFQEAYVAFSNTTVLALDECGRTSTTTAAILYHLLVGDFDFSFETPIPPIRNSWVITLITIELMIAFAVGVACVGLSLSLLKRENTRIASEEELHESSSYMAIQGSDTHNELLRNEEAVMEQDVE